MEKNMNVSSTTSSLIHQFAVNPQKAEGRLEGNKPDGDGDQDDSIRVEATKQTANASSATGSIGGNIDITA